MSLARVLAVVLLLISRPLQAAAIEKLHQFLETTRTVRADFAQTVISRNGRQTQTASGVMMFSRPGKFRWQLERPYRQLLVGDGEKVWIHDPDLRQVTVRKVGAALGGTPAALLAGDGTIERSFTLRESGEGDGLEWLEATPKVADSGFEKVRIGFAGSDLKAMELFDSLGQMTALVFSRLERNPRLAPSLFSFTPPPGTDLISD